MVKILIMDDEPALRSIVYNMLKPLGHELFTAEDGKQAIEVARKEVPDLAMLDMRVPDMDGLEVLVELKKINPNIKGIMLSGFGDVETAVGALKRGAFDYLSKPFKIEEVLKVVKHALESLPASGAAASQQPIPVTAAASPSKPSVQKSKGIPFPRPWIIGGIAGLIAVLCTAFLFTGGHREITVPCANPTALCFARSSVWITDWASGNIYQHAANAKLGLASIFKTANAQPSGVTFDGESLWTCSSIEKRIYKHKIDSALTVTNIYALPDISPSGLYFDGVNLWVIDNEKAKIYKHKLDDSLSVLGVYDSPAASPSGMFKEGDRYYLSDFKTNKIYQVDAKDFNVAAIYSLPPIKDDEFKLSGMTSDGKTIWVCSDGLPKVFRYALGDLKKEKY